MSLIDTISEVLFAQINSFGPIGEDEVHIRHNNADAMGDGLGLDDYELQDWATVDSSYSPTVEVPTTPGAYNYSPTLHQVIEGLVDQKRVLRDPSNPLIIRAADPTIN